MVEKKTENKAAFYKRKAAEYEAKESKKKEIADLKSKIKKLQGK